MHLLRSLLLLIPLACAGCSTFTTLGTARTLGAGTGEVVFAASAISVEGEKVAAAPQLEAGVRYGFTAWFDGGLRYSLGVLQVEGKFQLRRSEAAWLGLDLAVQPTVGYWGGESSEYEAWGEFGGLTVPLLIGINLGAHQLVLGPRVTGLVGHAKHLEGEVLTGPMHARGLLAGGGIGFAFAPWGQKFKLVPEIVTMVPVATRGFGPSHLIASTRPRFQAGIAVLMQP